MKNYKTWLRIAGVFQFIMAVMHALSLLPARSPKNETEKQLFDLMSSYKFNYGAGFHRTIDEVTFPLEISFSLFCLLGGLINWYLIGTKTDAKIMKGIIIINLIVFGICFGLLTVYTFLPPIILSGLIFTSLILSAITMDWRSRK